MMGRGIDNILGFHFDAGAFAGTAKGSLSDTVVKMNIQKVKDCTGSMLDGGDLLPEADLREFYEYLRACFDAKVPPEDVTASRQQLRSLSYAMEPKDIYEFVRYILKVMQCNWSATYLRGLLHSLLHHWETLNLDTRVAVSGFLVDMIREASSRASRRMNDMAAYLNELGPARLGEFLKSNGRPFDEALSIFDLSDRRISYTFFCECIVAYYTGANASMYGEIRNVLARHNNVRTTKSLVPCMILAEAEKRTLSKNLVDFAISMIGDPSIESAWAPFEGATETQAKNLERAREVVLAALSAAVINIFFEKLCNDGKRKRFWLKHTKKIKDFKVYGSSYSRQIMASEVSRNVLGRHFVTIPSKANTCALVMYMGDYAIIEFTDVGALYVYRKDSDSYGKVFGRGTHIESMDDLKLSYLSNLVDTDSYYASYSEEGRMVHIGHWDTRMSNWLKAKIK